MKLLLTGGSGFIGINIIEEFLNQGWDVLNIDAVSANEKAKKVFSKKKGTYSEFIADIRDFAAIMQVANIFKPDCLIHAAVVTATEEMERKNTKKIFSINCEGTLAMLDLAVQLNIKRFIYISSIAVYGAKAHQGEKLKENMNDLCPRNLYEISKYTSERLVLRNAYLTGLNVACCRLGDVFGKWEKKTNLRQQMSAPYQVIKLALEGKEAVLPRANKTNWVYVKDVSQGVYAVTSSQSLGSVINISSAYTWSIEDLCNELKKGYPLFSYRISSNKAEQNVTYFDEIDNAEMSIDLLKNSIHYQPEYGMSKALDDYMKWIQLIDKGECFNGLL